jgi:tRNA threonylcarbamoyladenosine biosynthesis protein TsaE
MNEQYHLPEIKEVVARFRNELGDKKVIAFHGSMGAGKTTFIHSFCEAMGVTDTVSSPTFSLINEYSYPGGIMYHIDLYRLNNAEEAQRAGVEDCLYSGDLCLVEWPERIPGLLPADTLHVFLEVLGTDKRSIRINNI